MYAATIIALSAQLSDKLQRYYWGRSQVYRFEPHMSQSIKFVYWQEGDAWLGYLQEYPDYWTQGDSLDDLKEHLKDLLVDVTGGHIPGIRKIDELALP